MRNKSCKNMSIENFSQYYSLSPSQNNNNHGSIKENFNQISEYTCNSDMSKKLLFKEIKEKHQERLETSEDIKRVKQLIININNEITNLINERNKHINNRMYNYGGPTTEYLRERVKDIDNIIPDLKNQITNNENYLKYLLSYNIEFAELQKEMEKLSQSTTTTMPSTTTMKPSTCEYKKLLFKEIEEKHQERLNNTNINHIRQRINNINNEISKLKKERDYRIKMANYGGVGLEMIPKIMKEYNDDVSDLTNQITNLDNEIKYLLSYNIEFIELQKELEKLLQPTTTTMPPTTTMQPTTMPPTTTMQPTTMPPTIIYPYNPRGL